MPSSNIPKLAEVEMRRKIPKAEMLLHLVYSNILTIFSPQHLKQRRESKVDPICIFNLFSTSIQRLVCLVIAIDHVIVLAKISN